ncbi:MAG: signal peptidase I [Chromatiales bacterium]|jgi:signal peptidase I
MDFDLPLILVLATAITGGIWLIDSLFFAKARKQQNIEKEPLILEYSKSFFPVILIVLLLRSFLVEPFRIPSGSMMPTLLVGDFILVNKFAYGIRLPVIDKKIIEIGEPQRGDVFVFRYPRQPDIDYIKRVVGIPGDIIDYRDKVLYVNGKPAEKTSIGVYTGVGAGARETGSIELVENLAGVEHATLVHPMAPNLPPSCTVLARGPIKVPEDMYFAMGDNRDNSNDSRCWGLVPEDHLVGKAFAIWMHWDGDRSGLPIAFDRIGNTIN